MLHTAVYKYIYIYIQYISTRVYTHAAAGTRFDRSGVRRAETDRIRDDTHNKYIVRTYISRFETDVYIYIFVFFFQIKFLVRFYTLVVVVAKSHLAFDIYIYINKKKINKRVRLLRIAYVRVCHVSRTACNIHYNNIKPCAYTHI